MNHRTFKAWLDAYGRAWEGRDPESAASLYAENGTYQVTPFLEPMRGRSAILEYWSQVCRTERNVKFDHEILAVTPDVGIARWWASFFRVPQKIRIKLDGIFVISLDANNQCTRLREWWVKQETQVK